MIRDRRNEFLRKMSGRRVFSHGDLSLNAKKKLLNNEVNVTLKTANKNSLVMVQVGNK